jgi:ELWxxDGT repeat protein
MDLFFPRSTNRPRLRRSQPGRRPALEVLEARCLLSAYLVQDLNTRVGSSLDPPGPEFTDVNGTAYFMADDGIHGPELWKSDGTEAGTRLVKDINRGPGSSITNGDRTPTNVNGAVFFTADDGIHGAQLWKSDGTAAGTVQLTDFPVADHLLPVGLTNVNGTLFFGVISTSEQSVPDLTGLYTSDGIAADTIRISDAIPMGSPLQTEANGDLFFFGYESPQQNEGLWKSDGTSAGTVLLRSLPETDYQSNMVNVNGTVFFAAVDARGDGLWKSDGTPDGTVAVDPAELAGRYPEGLINFNGTLFFHVSRGADSSLWKSDGTDAGTTPVNPPGVTLNTTGSIAAGGTLYFGGNDGSGQGLWKTDGTPEGTVLVSPGNLSVLKAVDFNGTLAFLRLDASGTNNVLWTSDGTPGGTRMIRAFPFLENLAAVNGLLYFSADDGVHGKQPWISDGTPDGTVLLKDIFAGNVSSDPNHLVQLNGAVYFLATTDSGPELLRSDGTINGVTEVAPSYSDSLILIGNTLYFTGPGTRGLPALHRSDGTSAGTSDVRDLGEGSTISNLTAVGNQIFFTTNDSANSTLWVSDGTTAGTRGLATLPSVGNFTDVNGELYFSADDGTHGDELWHSDGTAAGTSLVADINPGPTGSNPAHLTNVNGTLFFSADDGVNGRELWQSDGTPGGTVLAADINPGPDGSDPRGLTVYNGVLFFSAFEPTAGRELWQYDPASGVASVIDINPGPGSSNPAWLTVMSGLLYFSADDGTNGHQLWVTDGTAAGTSLVADIRPGGRGSNPQHLFAAANGLLYFTANDGSNGRQLWQSDGTAAGTTLVQVINPTGNAFWSFYNPWFTEVNGNLFFVADDRVHGRELWVLTPGMAPSGGSAAGGGTATLPWLWVEPAALSVPAPLESPPAAVFVTNRQEGSPASRSSAASEEPPLQPPNQQASASDREDAGEPDAVFLGDWLVWERFPW